MNPTVVQRFFHPRKARLYYGEDATAVLKTLSSESVHTAITSPPYFNVRDYETEGQIGHESSPQEYIESLIVVFNELYRVLRDDGTFWLVIGDKVADASYEGGIKKGDLIGIPWMLAFALRRHGWYLKMDNVWHKPNPVPEGWVRRSTRAHEFVFMFTKHPSDYYYDCHAVSEPVEKPGKARPFRDAKENSAATMRNDNGRIYIPQSTRNKRSVWTVALQRSSEKHYATFPEKLVETMIKAGTAPACCGQCGKPQERLIETEMINGVRHIRTVSWKFACSCKVPSVAVSVVLDPFSGTATTGTVALDLERDYIGIDINRQYLEMAENRILGKDRTGDITVEEDDEANPRSGEDSW